MQDLASATKSARAHDTHGHLFLLYLIVCSLLDKFGLQLIIYVFTVLTDGNFFEKVPVRFARLRAGLTFARTERRPVVLYYLGRRVGPLRLVAIIVAFK